MVKILYFSALLVAVSAQAWNGLKVKWGVPLVDEYAFLDVPRTVAEAQADGWQQLSGCGDSSQFVGRRWAKYDFQVGGLDYAVMPIYDKNGFIAGISTGIPTNIPGYPASQIRPPFVRDSLLNRYTMSAYFVDPSIICSRGRTQSEFNSQGTGDRLVLQNGTSTTRIPNRQSGLSTTQWTLGKCFEAMGVHYWYNIRRSMSCDEFYPMFLLYNNARLNSFGWAFGADVPGPRYEHPPAWAIGAFLPDTAPDCIFEKEVLSTLHIYMTDDPDANTCP